MNVCICVGNTIRALAAEPGQTILELLRTHGIAGVHSPCGGNGSCKKCEVVVSSGGISEQRLACQTIVTNGMYVELRPETQLAVQESGQCAIYLPDNYTASDGDCGVACDIGTTTVVCHLFDLKTGRRLATVSGGNAQRSFGGDVIARIQASIEGKRERLTELIIEQINASIQTLCHKAKRDLAQVKRMAVAGNTTMCHLFAGLAPDTIGLQPFAPLSLFGSEYTAAELGLCIDGTVYIAPAISGYVGGDVAADILAAELFRKERPALLIDIGTNGEMAIGHGGSFMCCATAAGPAFEGAEIKLGMPASVGAVSGVSYHDGVLACKIIGDAAPVGICGSGLIDALAVMLELGAVDETGRMPDPDEAPREAARFLGEDEDGLIFCLTEDRTIYITQADVRKLQLAKAAIAAGIQILMKKFGTEYEQISALILAGGFGSCINPAAAAKIGLIPEKLLNVTAAVGNAAGEGAASALLSEAAREQLDKIQKACQYIELSAEPDFYDAYIDAMMFGGQ